MKARCNLLLLWSMAVEDKFKGPRKGHRDARVDDNHEVASMCITDGT